jgi:hypothetical protein
VARGELIGRDEESEVVDSLVGHIADGGGSLLIRASQASASRLCWRALVGRPPP